jgi:2-haloacid dehalogenase
MPAKHYDWLLFDADDTLFDYQKAETQALADAFRHAEIAVTPADIETYREINHRLWLALERGELTPEIVRVRRFEQLFEAMRIAAPALAFSQTYVACLGAQSILIDGARDLLDALHGRCRCAIVTNGLSDVQRSRLARSSIHSYIETLIISEEIGWSKPAAEFFDAAFAAIGDPPRDSVMIIGDSLTSDMAGGAAYGIDTCWYNPTRKPRPETPRITHEVANLAEILELLS